MVHCVVTGVLSINCGGVLIRRFAAPIAAKLLMGSDKARRRKNCTELSLWRV